jgi:hypothetical protein
MGKIYYSRQGREVDVEAIMLKHQHKRTLGNTNMNARGDILALDGTVKITAEQIHEEYIRTKANQTVQKQGGYAVMPDVFETPEEAVNRLKQEMAAQKAAQPNPQQTTTTVAKRKMIER